MKNLDIKGLSNNYRHALETARDNGEFERDITQTSHFKKCLCTLKNQ